MEGLWSLLVLFGVVASIIQKLKKAPPPPKGQSGPSQQRAGSTGNPWRQKLPPDPFDPTSWGAFFEQERQQAAPAPAPASAFSPPPPPRELAPAMEGGSLGWGSLSTEGIDTCDASLGHTRPSVRGAEPTAPESAPASGFSLSFTPDALVQGIIMSEILTRPSRRKRGWR